MIIDKIGVVILCVFALYVSFILGRFYNAIHDKYNSYCHHLMFKSYVKDMYRLHGLHDHLHYIDKVDADLKKEWG